MDRPFLGVSSKKKNNHKENDHHPSNIATIVDNSSSSDIKIISFLSSAISLLSQGELICPSHCLGLSDRWLRYLLDTIRPFTIIPAQRRIKTVNDSLSNKQIRIHRQRRHKPGKQRENVRVSFNDFRGVFFFGHTPRCGHHSS